MAERLFKSSITYNCCICREEPSKNQSSLCILSESVGYVRKGDRQADVFRTLSSTGREIGCPESCL